MGYKIKNTKYEHDNPSCSSCMGTHTVKCSSTIIASLLFTKLRRKTGRPPFLHLAPKLGVVFVSPNPRQRLVAALLDDLQVSDLDTAHRKVRDLELHLDVSSRGVASGCHIDTTHQHQTRRMAKIA